MNIFASLRYPFKDPNWWSIITGAGCLMYIPVLGQIVWAGYALSVIREVVHGNEDRMPLFKTGDGYREGMKVSIAKLLYILPGLIISWQTEETQNSDIVSFLVILAGSSLYYISLLRYVTTGKYSTFWNVWASLKTLFRNFGSVIFVALVIALWDIALSYISIALLMVIVGLILNPFLYAYTYIVSGFMIAKLAEKLNITPPREPIFMPVSEQTSLQSGHNSRQLQPTTATRTARPLPKTLMTPNDPFPNAVVYEIRVPKATKFDPEKAHSLVQQLALQFQEVTLAIVATHNSITWQVWDLRKREHPDLVPRTIKSIYPDADIVVRRMEYPSVENAFNRYVMLYRQNDDFVEPIKYIHDLKKRDPLASLVQTMRPQKVGERITHIIQIASATSDKERQNAFSRITQSAANPFDVINLTSWEGAGETVGSMVGSLFNKNRVPLNPERFPHQMERLNSHLLMNCFVLTQIDVFDSLDLNIVPTFSATFADYVTPEATNMIHFDVELSGENAVGVSDLAEERATSALGILASWMQTEGGRHTQTRAILSPLEIASLWHLPDENFATPEVEWVISGKPTKEILENQEGVIIGDSSVANFKYPIRIHPKDRETHMYTIGKTGTGKSTFLHNCIHQDIQDGKGVGVLDPHGKLVRDILRLSIPDDRIDDVVVLDIRNFEYPPPLNPLQAPGRDENYAAGEVVAILETIEGSLPPRIANSLNAAFVTIRKELTPTVRDVVRLFRDSEYRYKFISQVGDPITQDYWEDYEQMSPGRQDELRGPIMHRMGRFYRNPILYPILCHPQPINFQDLIKDKRIVLMSLGIDEAQVPETERRLAGVINIKQFQMAAMSSLKKQEFFLYIDEVQNFITAPLNVILEQARKFGLRLNIANQYLGQLGKVLPSVMGNIGTSVIFQVGQDDAHKLAKYFEPEFDEGALSDMDKYHAAIKTRFLNNTAPAFKIATRPEPQDLFVYDLESTEAEEREQMIRERSITNYTPMTRDEILTWLKERYPPKNFAVPKSDKEDIDWQVKGDKDA